MACLRGVSGVLTTRKWRAYYPILIFSTLRRRYARAEKVVNYFYKNGERFLCLFSSLHDGRRTHYPKKVLIARAFLTKKRNKMVSFLTKIVFLYPIKIVVLYDKGDYETTYSFFDFTSRHVLAWNTGRGYYFQHALVELHSPHRGHNLNDH